VFVSQPTRKQRLDAALIIFAPLRLEIRATIALGRSGGVAGKRAFIPFQSEPAHAVKDDVDSFLGVARGVSVLDAKHERAAGVAGIKPVKQSGAGAPDVEVAGGRWCKSNPSFHVH